MHSVIEFLKEVFGPSWRTASLGIVLIILALPCLGIGILLTMSPTTLQAGIAITTQGGLMIATGGGFLMTRDDKASEQAVQQIDRKIAAAQRESAQDHAENVQKIAKIEEGVEEVKAVVKPADGR